MEKQWMQQAVDVARKGIQAGQSPFGAVIIKGNQLVAASHNRVWKESDPTAHAEVNAIREACKALRLIDLTGFTMFTTCEPCPMCLTAIHWAKIDRVVYGATIADAATAGFEELEFPAAELAKKGKSRLIVEHGAYPECAKLFAEWKNAALGKSY